MSNLEQLQELKAFILNAETNLGRKLSASELVRVHTSIADWANSVDASADESLIKIRTFINSIAN